jgi:hypothetical protein
VVVEEDCVDDERCQELASGHHFDFSLLLVAWAGLRMTFGWLLVLLVVGPWLLVVGCWLN